MSTHQYLDLSTGHVMQATMDLLSNGGLDLCREQGWPAMTIAPYPFGCFVTVPNMTQEAIDALPPDLCEVFEYAFNLAVRLVRFDSDGDQIDELQHYDW
jgi:hypothetical protein